MQGAISRISRSGPAGRGPCRPAQLRGGRPNGPNGFGHEEKSNVLATTTSSRDSLLTRPAYQMKRTHRVAQHTSVRDLNLRVCAHLTVPARSASISLHLPASVLLVKKSPPPVYADVGVHVAARKNKIGRSPPFLSPRCCGPIRLAFVPFV